MRWLIRLGGTLDPFGGMPRDMRLAYWRNRGRLRAAVQEMIALAPHRVILAHGRWYRNDGTAQLRRAFHWLLPGSPTADPIPKQQYEVTNARQSVDGGLAGIRFEPNVGIANGMVRRSQAFQPRSHPGR